MPEEGTLFPSHSVCPHQPHTCVQQLVYDDDNSMLRQYQGPTVPGGHCAFTRTATVYSRHEITAADLELDSNDPLTEALRSKTAAFVQRVANCYLVEANILGFAGDLGHPDKQSVLSSALKWALSDYGVRFGKQPDQAGWGGDLSHTPA